MRSITSVQRTLYYSLVWLGIIVILIPVLYTILSSFKTPGEVARAFSLPSGLYLENYHNVVQSSNVIRALINSIIVTSGTLVLSIIVCSIAAYPISRRKDRGFKYLLLFFLSAMMIPSGSNLVALYVIIKKFHLIDNLLSLVLLSSSHAIPIGVLLYTGFIKTIPESLDEAAIMDGCGYWRRYWNVIFPLLRVATVTFAVLTCIGVWNDFLNPLMFIKSPDKNTLTLLVYNFKTEHEVNWGSIYALLTIAFIPPALFFMFMQKYFYGGFAAGAIKG